MLFALIGGLLYISSCDDEQGKTDEEIYLEKLTSTWQVQLVTLDSEDVTGFYTNMTLTIGAEGNYITTQGNPPIWPASGNFALEKLTNSEHYKLKRNDGVELTVTTLDANNLKYTFQYTSPGGRSKSVSGVYEFTMSK